MLEPAAIQSLNRLTGEESQAVFSGNPSSRLNRRNFLKLTALSLGSLALTPALARITTARERALYIYTPNTGETIRAVYWTPVDGYLHESLRDLSWTLRDHYNDQVKAYDPRVLDQLYLLQVLMEYEQQPLHVISGYRSPSTNAMLRLRSRGVARDSFHMYGMATDLRMPGRGAGELRRAALSLNAGGVGFYPRAGFVHVDSGPVRAWSR